MASYEAGFIGAGNMGGALAVAAVKQVGGARVAVTCSTPEHTASTAARLDCRPETAENILANSRFVFLGVKPQAVSGVLAGLTEAVASSEAVLVSMLAGVTLERLADLLGADKKIIRIMPNTPCTVEEGLILYAANDRVSGEELDAFLRALAPQCWRMKGFLPLDTGWTQVDVVGKYIDYKPCPAREQGELVIISRIGPAVIRPIMDGWKQLVSAEMTLRN